MSQTFQLLWRSVVAAAMVCARLLLLSLQRMQSWLQSARQARWLPLAQRGVWLNAEPARFACWFLFQLLRGESFYSGCLWVLASVLQTMNSTYTPQTQCQRQQQFHGMLGQNLVERFVVLFLHRCPMVWLCCAIRPGNSIVAAGSRPCAGFPCAVGRTSLQLSATHHCTNRK